MKHARADYDRIQDPADVADRVLASHWPESPSLRIAIEAGAKAMRDGMLVAAQGGMPQAEAEAHFGTSTAAGAGDLVEGLRAHIAALGVACCTCGAKTFQAEFHDANCKVRNVAEALDNVDDLASRIEALEAEVARLKYERDVWHSKSKMHQKAAAGLCSVTAERDALKAEVGRLRRADMACRWYWPENSTESENCADSPQEVVQNAYGWEEPRGDVVAVARGGVVEVTYCAALPPAPDSDSDDEFWVEEATKEAATAKITAELERRAALSPAKAGG